MLVSLTSDPDLSLYLMTRRFCITPGCCHYRLLSRGSKFHRRNIWLSDCRVIRLMENSSIEVAVGLVLAKVLHHMEVGGLKSSDWL